MTDSSPEGTAQQPASPSSAVQVDPLKKQMLLQSLRENQRLGPGISMGFLAAVLGASVWALISELTNHQIGWMAVGLGFGVAYVVRTVGKGIDRVFGYWSAGLSLLGCVLGNVLIIAIEVSKQEQMSFTAVLFTVLLHPTLLFHALAATFNPIDLLFYALTLYYGYKYAFRAITADELNSISAQS